MLSFQPFSTCLRLLIKNKPAMKTIFIIVLFLTINVNTFAQSLWWPENGQTFSNISNINFADNNTGWFFGDSTIGPIFKDGIIKKTNNQGLSWTAQNMGSDSIQILSSYVFSTSTVIAVGKFQTNGNGAMIKTINGGTSWTKDTTSFSENLFDVDFATSVIGWVSGRNGYIARTNNAGTSWAMQVTPNGEDLFSVDFADLNFGWAVGSDPGTGGSIIHTTNGGATWNTQTNTATGDLFSLYIFNPAQAIAVGQGGGIVMTADSGNTWIPKVSGTGNDLFAVSFVDPLNGWVSGAGGTIIITSDGGNTWASQVSGTVNNINSIHMKNTGLGWYCGDNGDVYFYGSTPVSVDGLNSNYSVNIFPNPMNDASLIQIEGKNIDNWDLVITDMTGKKIKEINNIKSSSFLIQRENFSSGIYLYSAYNKDGIIAHGKLSIP